MLSLEDLQRFSAELKIDRERIAREYYELLVLNELSAKAWSRNLIFKGGTALRLAYGSPRFSDDLDFSYNKPVRANEIFTFARELSKKYNFNIRDSWDKRETILIEFNIRQIHLPQAFRLKLEISKRSSKALRNELKLLKSPTALFEVLFNVQTLESILDEKLNAIRERDESRDVFDIWYICKKLDKPIPVIEREIDARKLKQTINKYLPKHWYYVLDEIAKEIKRT